MLAGAGAGRLSSAELTSQEQLPPFTRPWRRGPRVVSAIPARTWWLGGFSRPDPQPSSWSHSLLLLCSGARGSGLTHGAHTPWAFMFNSGKQ